MKAFANEPILELRRAPIRAQLADALAEHDARPAVQVPVWVGGERREAAELVSTDPGKPDRVVAEAAAATPGRGRGGAGARLRPRRAHVGARRRRSGAPRSCSRRPRGCGERRLEIGGARGPRGGQALARGRRRRLRGDRLPRVLRARRARPRAGRAAAAGAGRAQRAALRAARRRRGDLAVELPGRDPARDGRRRPRHRQRGDPQAGRADARLRGACSCRRCARPACRPRRSRCCRARATSAPRSCATRACTRSPSPAPTRSASRSSAPPPRCPTGQRHLKRVVAEMGGKNAVIVDSDADLDEVVPALVASAFVFAGQKCSAAARVLCHEAIHDALVERLAGAVEVLQVGQAERLDTDVPPVIEQEAQERVARYAEEAERSGPDRRAGPRRAGRGLVRHADARRRPAAGLPGADRGDLRPAARGRAGARRRGRLRPASTPPPSRSPPGCSPATPTPSTTSSTRVPVGNLYVNRSITGAMVARQPFGGNRLSGTGTKAGGPGYLLQFVEPRVVTENTMRHGLVV